MVGSRVFRSCQKISLTHAEWFSFPVLLIGSLAHPFKDQLEKVDSPPSGGRIPACSRSVGSRAPAKPGRQPGSVTRLYISCIGWVPIPLILENYPLIGLGIPAFIWFWQKMRERRKGTLAETGEEKFFKRGRGNLAICPAKKKSAALGLFDLKLYFFQ